MKLNDPRNRERNRKLKPMNLRKLLSIWRLGNFARAKQTDELALNLINEQGTSFTIYQKSLLVSYCSGTLCPIQQLFRWLMVKQYFLISFNVYVKGLKLFIFKFMLRVQCTFGAHMVLYTKMGSYTHFKRIK